MCSRVRPLQKSDCNHFNFALTRTRRPECERGHKKTGVWSREMKRATWVKRKMLWGVAANEMENEKEMKTSSRGGGNELQIAAMFELRVIKGIKDKNQHSQSCLHVSSIEKEDGDWVINYQCILFFLFLQYISNIAQNKMWAGQMLQNNLRDKKMSKKVEKESISAEQFRTTWGPNKKMRLAAFYPYPLLLNLPKRLSRAYPK